MVVMWCQVSSFLVLSWNSLWKEHLGYLLTMKCICMCRLVCIRSQIHMGPLFPCPGSH